MPGASMLPLEDLSELRTDRFFKIEVGLRIRMNQIGRRTERSRVQLGVEGVRKPHTGVAEGEGF